MTMNLDLEPSSADLEHKLETDNRHLQKTIGALRDQLERQRLESSEAVQKAVAAISDELGQLKATANALRDRLEQMRIEKEEGIQRVRSEANDKICQLESTANALRDELEKMRIESDEDVQRLRSTTESESAQLRETINAVRDEFDKSRIDGDEKVQKINVSSQDEIGQLQSAAHARRELPDLAYQGRDQAHSHLSGEPLGKRLQRALQRNPAQGSSQCRVVHFNQTGSDRHRNLAEAVQSHSPASGSEYAPTGARDTTRNWYIERGLYTAAPILAHDLLKTLPSGRTNLDRHLHVAKPSLCFAFPSLSLFDQRCGAPAPVIRRRQGGPVSRPNNLCLSMSHVRYQPR